MTPPALTAAALGAVRHGFFGRKGGVSAGLYASLNCGPGSNDDPAAVTENRARVAQALGVTTERLLSLHQVHSATAVRVDGPWGPERPQADALVTTTRGLALSALAADCAPILFADSAAGVIAAAHAGWKGALGGVIEATVAAMAQAGAAPARITAAIGPCIGQASYEVGPDFVARFVVADPATSDLFLPGAGDRSHFDLAGYCARKLAAAGVGRIDIVAADTCAQAQEFFSHRRSVKAGATDYGRNISAIVLD